MAKRRGKLQTGDQRTDQSAGAEAYKDGPARLFSYGAAKTLGVDIGQIQHCFRCVLRGVAHASRRFLRKRERPLGNLLRSPHCGLVSFTRCVAGILRQRGRAFLEFFKIGANGIKSCFDCIVAAVFPDEAARSCPVCACAASVSLRVAGYSGSKTDGSSRENRTGKKNGIPAREKGQRAQTHGRFGKTILEHLADKIEIRLRHGRDPVV